MLARFLALALLPSIVAAGVTAPVAVDYGGADLTLVPQDPTVGGVDKLLLFSAPLTSNLVPDLSVGDPTATFARNCTATYKDGDNKLATAAKNTPRYGLADEGVLIEAAAVNAVQWSEAMENALWLDDASCSVFQDVALGPDASTTSADEVRETADDTWQGLYQGFTGDAGTIDVLSVFAKKNDRTIAHLDFFDDSTNNIESFYDIDAGVVLGHSITGNATVLHRGIEAWDNDWYRIVLAVKTHTEESRYMNFGPALADLKSVYTGDAAKGVIFFGAQVEVNTATGFETSYQTAVANGGTRYADSLAWTNVGNLPTTGPGTIAATLTPKNHLYKAMTAVSTAAWPDGYWLMGSNEGPFARSVGGDWDVSAASGALAVGTGSRLAVTWDQSRMDLYHDGIRVGSDAAVSLATSTTLAIGGFSGATAHYVKDVKVYRAKLDASDLP